MIDPVSVVICAGASVVVALLLGLLLSHDRHGDPASRCLMASNFAYLVAVIGILTRPFIGFEVSAFIVLGGAYTGICLAFTSVLIMESRPIPVLLMVGVGMLSLVSQAAFAHFVDSALPLMATSSIINGSLTAWMTVVVWQLLSRRGRRSALLTTLPFAVLSAGYLIRLIVVFAAPSGSGPLFATLLIITIMSWSAIILELGMLASVERRVSAELTDALANAEEIEKIKARERFFLSISHELRTPLNGVIGLSSLMKDQTAGPLPEKYLKFAGSIHESGIRLMDLVSNLIDILNPQTTIASDSHHRTPLAHIIDEVSHDLSPLARSNHVELTCTTNLPPGALVCGDGRRIQRMLRHLAENAIKYATSQAHIKVETTDGNGLAISVEDDGPGMNAIEVDIALELFGRVKGIDDPNAGAGVGLTLAAAIARSHGTTLSFNRSAIGGLSVSLMLENVANKVLASAPAR